MSEAQLRERFEAAEQRMRDVARWYPKDAEVWTAAANEIRYVLDGEKPHCCEHDFDAHDGSGCLDCACNKAPWSEGYNPVPMRRPSPASSHST